MTGKAGRNIAIGLTAVAALTALDYSVGRQHRQTLEGRRMLKANLDRIAFRDLRTAIDDIVFVGPSDYRLSIRMQNASDMPFYVTLPSMDGFLQVDFKWEPFPVAEEAGQAPAGSVVRLADEVSVERRATIEATDYARNLPGYMHTKFILDVFVSPVADPEEEVGERHEEIGIYLRDARQPPAFPSQASFIPLRGWTTIPKERN